MSEYQLWHIHLLLGVHDDWYTLTVVPNFDAALRLINSDFDLRHSSPVSLYIVSRIHDYLIKYLQQPRNIRRLSLHHTQLFSFIINDPHLLLVALH